MEVSPIAYSYWRLIKACQRTYDSVPDQMKENVRIIAAADVTSGIITEEQYELYINEKIKK